MLYILPMKTNNNKSNIGEKIRFFRKLKGLSQSQLGNKIGISKRMVVYYECHANRVPKLEIIQAMAKVFNCSIDDLLDPKKEIKPQRTNTILWKKLRKVEDLQNDDQKAIITMIERLAKK